MSGSRVAQLSVRPTRFRKSQLFNRFQFLSFSFGQGYEPLLVNPIKFAYDSSDLPEVRCYESRSLYVLSKV